MDEDIDKFSLFGEIPSKSGQSSSKSQSNGTYSEEFVDKTTLFGEFEQKPVTSTRREGGGALQNDVRKSSSADSISSEIEEEMDSDSGQKENFEDTLRLRIIQVATASNGFFKHQQRGDPDLTRQEKRRIVTELLDNRPAVFIQRFGKFLSEDHLSYFEDVIDGDYEINFYLREARQRQCKYVQEHKVKNRRFTALQKMISEGDDHFSEEAMRSRNPLLYDQLIRKYQTEEEREAVERPDMSNCSLSNIIIEHMDLNRERELKKRLQAVDDEEFDTDSEEERDKQEQAQEGSHNIGQEEKMVLRREFVNAAYQSFLAGKDPGIDYRQIDENSDLDDLAMEDQENEERYFDDDVEVDE